MISAIEIEGFKSFGTPGEEVRLDRLNFLVGANASGKSNLISALRFLKNAVLQNVEHAVTDLGGSLEVRNRILRQRKEPKPVRLRVRIDESIEAKVAESQWRMASFDYEVSLDLRSEGGAPTIVSELLEVPVTREGEQAIFSLHRDAAGVVIRDPMRNGGEPVEIPVPKGEATRLALGVGFFAVPCVMLRDLIKGWGFYNIAPNVARQAYREEPEPQVGPAGENLAVVLHRIENSRTATDLDAIISGLRGAVPGFKSLKTTKLPVEGKWAFQVIEEKIRGAMNPDSVSDGTIRLLSLLVLTRWTARRSSLIAIEEPENGIHPHLSEHLVEIFRSSRKRTQFLIATHNPDFLDFLEPTEVVLCDKEDGFTRLKRAADVQQIEQFRKHFSLGELWVQGTLGGIL